MKEGHNTRSKTSRFIEHHCDGTATLHYPGWPPRKYASVNSAFNRRRTIDMGATRPDQRLTNRPWSEEEKAFVRANWGAVLPHEWPNQLPGRTYSSVKTYARDHKIRASDNCSNGAPRDQRVRQSNSWTDEELEILRTNTREKATSLLKARRTAKAIEAKALQLGLHSSCRHRPWSPEEIIIIYHNNLEKCAEILRSSRTKRAIANKRQELKISSVPIGERWSDRELALIRNVIRSTEALKTNHRRSLHAISNKVYKERQRKIFSDKAVAAVKSACINVEPAIRADIEGELLIKVLSKDIKITDIGAEVRAARTQLYGRRHFSLDAPIGDGSTTWIENISSDQIHF